MISKNRFTDKIVKLASYSFSLLRHLLSSPFPSTDFPGILETYSREDPEICLHPFKISVLVTACSFKRPPTSTSFWMNSSNFSHFSLFSIKQPFSSLHESYTIFTFPFSSQSTGLRTPLIITTLWLLFGFQFFCFLLLIFHRAIPFSFVDPLYIKPPLA
jgi:hypothetical protein